MNRLAAFLSTLILAAALPQAAEAEYKYTHVEGEYIVELPDAPTGQTIWGTDASIPYLVDPPKYGSLGEYAYIKREDPDTGDTFDVRITFLKADNAFLQSLTEDGIRDDLENEFPNTALEETKFNFSQGTGTLKWGTYSGFSVNRSNEILYNTAHYLVGQSSIMVVRVVYSVQNESFNQSYKTLAKSIAYTGR